MSHADDRREALIVAHQLVVLLRIGQLATDDVCVRIDESRHERGVAEIDRPGAGGHVHRTLLADGDDPVVRHDDHTVRDRRAAGAVDEPRGAERDGAGAFGFLCAGSRGDERRGERDETRVSHRS